MRRGMIDDQATVPVCLILSPWTPSVSNVCPGVCVSPTALRYASAEVDHRSRPYRQAALYRWVVRGIPARPHGPHPTTGSLLQGFGVVPNQLAHRIHEKSPSSPTRQPNKVTCFNRIGPSSKCVCNFFFFHHKFRVRKIIYIYIFYIFTIYLRLKEGRGKTQGANPPLAQERVSMQRQGVQGKGGRG